MSNWSLSRSMVSRRRVLRGAALGGVGLAGAALVGCGGEDDDPAATSVGGGAATATGTSAATADPGGPVRGGTLRGIATNDPRGLDMHNNSSFQDATTITPLYNTLVKAVPGGAGGIESDLAKSWEVTDDGTVTFHLHENARWHDGVDFTAEDVVWNFDRMQNPPEGVRQLRSDWYDSIVDIQAVDAKTVVFTQSYPRASLLPHFAVNFLSMMAPHAIDRVKTAPIGTGPYRFGSYDVGVAMRWERNEDYFKEGRPYMDGINIAIAPDTRTQMEAFQAGQLDALLPMARLDDATAKELAENLPEGATYQTFDGMRVFNMVMNQRNPVFADQRVRKAIHLLTSRQEAIDVLAEGQGIIGSYLPPSADWIQAGAVEGWPGYRPSKDEDLTEAKRLLEAAGITSDSAVRARLLTRGELYGSHPVYFASVLEPFGFATEPVAVDTGIESQRLADGEFEIRTGATAQQLADPDNIVRYHHTDGDQNTGKYSNPKMDALLERQSREQDENQRRETVDEIVALLEEDHPRPSIYWAVNYLFLHEQFKNYKPGPGVYLNNSYETEWLDS